MTTLLLKRIRVYSKFVALMNVAKGNSSSWSLWLTACGAFSHDVTAAILLFQNMFQSKETAAMFGYVGVPRKSSRS